MENEVVLDIGGDKAADFDVLAAFQRQLTESTVLDKLPTTEFNQVYRDFNAFIVKFFDDRRKAVEDMISERSEKDLKNVEEERRKTFLAKLRNEIAHQATDLKLCLNTCYSCKLVCVNQSGHRSTIEVEKQNTRSKIFDAQKALKEMEPKEQEQELIHYGLDKKEVDYS